MFCNFARVDVSLVKGIVVKREKSVRPKLCKEKGTGCER
jgi:hypothetical protein